MEPLVTVINPWVPTDDGPELVLTFDPGLEIAPRPPEFDECILPGTIFEVIAPGWTGDVAHGADGRIELLGWTRDLRIRADRRLTPDGRLAAVKLGLLQLASQVNYLLNRHRIENEIFTFGYDYEIEFLETLQDTELAEAASWALEAAWSKQHEHEDALRQAFPGDYYDYGEGEEYEGGDPKVADWEEYYFPPRYEDPDWRFR
jgi:hypothetical protein